MISSRLEKLLYILIWYFLIITFRFVLPISEPPSNIDKYVIIFLSSATTIILLHGYTFYRNKNVLKRINFFLETNALEEAEMYINKCLVKQKSRSLYMYKLYVLVMCGHIAEFEKTLKKYQQNNKYKRLLSLDFVKKLTYIIDYFKTPNACIYPNQQNRDEAANTISAPNSDNNIPTFLSIYSRTKFSLIKSFFAFKLYLTYKENKNFEKADHYYCESLKCAPSLEIAYYIENSRQNKSNQK